MYLKTLELQGFKSFADKTAIELNQGISAIVGPNGSGKSNIVESIKWVLGENKAKSLRGHKMEDVIFNGTKKRKPMGMAEVSLILDNSDYGMDSEYTEIKVTRRLYRSGDGEYLINGKNCRLKDIHQLFADTGIGNDGYSVIGQGRISQIVEAKPEERRAMVEETAGIVKYRERKKEALRKIASADDNLLRLRDIMTEIESRLDPLEQDAINARKYLKFKEEKDALSIGILAETALEAREKLTRLETEVTVVEEKYQDICATLLQKEARLEEQKAALAEIEDAYGSEQQRYHSLSSEIQKLEGDVKSLESRVFGFEEKHSTLENEIQILKEKGCLSAGSLKEEQHRNVALETKTVALKQELDVLREQRVCEEADLVKTEERMEELRKLAFEAARQGGQKKNEKLALTQSLSGLEKRLAAMAEKGSRYEEENVALDQRIEEINDFLDDLLSQEQEINEKKQGYITGLATEKASANAKREKALAVKMDISRSEARLKVLEELIMKREGFYPGVRAVLEEKGRGHLKGILGVVAEVVKVEKTYTVAIEAVLGSALQNIVAETGDDAAQAVSFLKKQRKGIATFLPLDLLKIRERQGVPQEIQKHPSYLGIAADYIKVPIKLKPVAEYLLGNTLLFQNLEDAIVMMRKTRTSFRFVSLEGDVVNSGGSVSGGSRDAKKNSFLQRQAETEELQKRIIALRNEETTLYDAVEAIHLKRDHMKKQLDVLDHRREELLLQKNSFDQEIQEIDHRRDLFERETQVLTIEEKQLKGEEDAAKNRIARLEEEIAADAKEETALMAEINQEEEAFKTAKSKESQGRDSYTELQIVYTEEKSGLEHSRMTLERLRTEGEENQNAITAKEIAWKEAIEKKAKAEAEIAALKAEVLDRNRSLANFSQDLEKGRIQKENITADKDCLEVELKTDRKAENELKEEVYKLSLKKERITVEAEQSEKQLQEEYQMMLAEALPYRREDMTKKDKREQIKALKQQIDLLGNVNVGAIEEFQVVTERYTFLTKQKVDVEEAKQALSEVVERMDTIITQRFIETFDKINVSFQETFPAFFQGGYGELRLSDPNHPLETGVEVVVQPPGKRLQHHSLLSGGELALSGIALLFAILQVKSSPFYVLDEIDAALDDVNVRKFGSYLEQYGVNSQFLVITHRQGTMASAGELYGITMAEDGVSRTVSVRLEEAIS